MKKPEAPPPRRKKHLTVDDEVLWEHTAQSIQPLQRTKTKGRVHPAVEDLPTPKAAKSKKADQAVEAPPAPSRKPAAPPPPVIVRKPPPLDAFDPKK